MSIDQSGPAFPCPEAGQSHFGDPSVYMGLSIRDYAALQFAAAMMANPEQSRYLHAHDERNEVAFAAADSWLKARLA